MAISGSATAEATPMTRAQLIAWCQAQARQAGITRPVPSAQELYEDFCNEWWKRRGWPRSSQGGLA